MRYTPTQIYRSPHYMTFEAELLLVSMYCCRLTPPPPNGNTHIEWRRDLLLLHVYPFIVDAHHLTVLT